MSSDASAILALLLYATVIAAIVVRETRRTGHTFHAWVCCAIGHMWTAFFHHLRTNRRCPFPAEGPAIILANHRSPADPMIILSAQRLGRADRRQRVIGFMTAREYYEIRGLRWICEAMQSIPVDRNGKDMGPTREALERLKQGHLLGVFPEGRLNPGDDLLEGDSGVAWLALRSQAPVYPVYVQGSPSGMESMVKPFLTFARVKVIYGDPIDLSAYYDRRRNHELLTEVADLMMRRLADLGGVKYAKDVAVDRGDVSQVRLCATSR